MDEDPTWQHDPFPKKSEPHQQAAAAKMIYYPKQNKARKK
jgi:hypothetical protein